MGGALRKDPAIEQFARMRENSSKYFKFNKKSGPFLLFFMGVLPAAVGYLSYKTHGQIQLAGVRRGETIYRDWPESVKRKPEAAETSQ